MDRNQNRDGAAGREPPQLLDRLRAKARILHYPRGTDDAHADWARRPPSGQAATGRRVVSWSRRQDARLSRTKGGYPARSNRNLVSSATAFLIGKQSRSSDPTPDAAEPPWRVGGLTDLDNAGQRLGAVCRS
jgi:hypothetical protein